MTGFSRGDNVFSWGGLAIYCKRAIHGGLLDFQAGAGFPMKTPATSARDLFCGTDDIEDVDSAGQHRAPHPQSSIRDYGDLVPK